MDKLTIISGAGSYVYDREYKQYLDFSSGGIFACPFGIQDQGILQVLAETQPFATYGAHYDTLPALRLKSMLKEWTGYESVVLFSTGAEATEAFWRACRVYTGKPGVWGGLINPDECGETNPLPDAMHGMTLGALIMAGKMRLPSPGMFKELGAYREGGTYDATGCAIWEPYHAPSAQFHREQPTMNKIRENIKTFPHIHFCCEEVQGGMGRTGKMFAHQWYSPEIRSEFVVLGKMLGGGLPLSALLGPAEILEDESVVENAHLHSTHSGNPLNASVGCHVIERMQSDDLVDYSFQMGKVLEEGLEDVKQRHHCGKGLLAGIEFDGPLMASMVVNACRKRGLLVVDTGRKWVKLGPQLNIRADQIMEGCEILKQAIEEVENEIEAYRHKGEVPGEGVGDVQAAGVQPGGSGGDVQGTEADGSQVPDV